LKNFFKSVHFNNSAFIVLLLAITLFSFGLLSHAFYLAGLLCVLAWLLAVLAESLFLYSNSEILTLERKVPIRLSNGDTGTINLHIKNNTAQSLWVKIYEDLPEQLQMRTFSLFATLPKSSSTIKAYTVQPKQRGQYHWQNTYLFVQKYKYSLVAKRITCEESQQVACYPSFEQFQKIPLQATVNNFKENGSEHYVRKIGQSLEFEKIKEYTPEDDYRHINWKASAKMSHLMLNQYQEERSQNVYTVIDMGRAMHMAFDGLSLLDYSINAALALNKAVLAMSDKAGVIGLQHNQCRYLPARKDFKQFGKINDFLYNLKSEYTEANYELLYKFMRINVAERSLLVIFKNFESVNSFRRELPYFKALSRYHLLLVVFFENTELANFAELPAHNTEAIYEKTIAADMLLKNKLILRELNNSGIQSLYVPPQKLSIAAINRFVDIKKKRII
jgi:uncharacterized protein (DUF58 family)